MAILQKQGCRGVVGIGGGKTLDTAKAIGYYQKLPVVVIPTIASTDAPTSALSVIYTEAGEFEEYLIYPKNPDMVVMDTAIIAKAPVRLLVSGMGDALSTWFEAKACYDARATSMAGGQSTEAALSLARLCYDTLLAEGEKARLAAQAGVVTEALERIIEANTYLSGIGLKAVAWPPPTQSTTVSPFLKSAITCITVRKWPSVPWRSWCCRTARWTRLKRCWASASASACR